MTTTVLYSTLGPDVVEYIINHAECPVVFVGSVHVPAILSLIKKLPTIKAIVSLDSWTSISAKGSRPGVSGADALKAWGDSAGVQVLDIVERESVAFRFRFNVKVRKLIFRIFDSSRGSWSRKP
jgi:long-chain acyl-CoA synthetase